MQLTHFVFSLQLSSAVTLSQEQSRHICEERGDDGPPQAEQPFGFLAIAFHPEYVRDKESGYHQVVRMTTAFSLPKCSQPEQPENGQALVRLEGRSTGEASWDMETPTRTAITEATDTALAGI